MSIARFRMTKDRYKMSTIYRFGVTRDRLRVNKDRYTMSTI